MGAPSRPRHFVHDGHWTSLALGSSQGGALLTRFAPALGMGILLAVVAFLSGINGQYGLFAFFVCGFALWGNLAEFIQPVRQRATANEGLLEAARNVLTRGRRRFGGHVAHLGVIMAVIAIALSKGYKAERDFTLKPGQSGAITPYEITYLDAELQPQPHRDSLVAHFQIRDGDRDLGMQDPRLNYYRAMREPIGTPAIYSTPVRDLYISLIELPEDGSYVTVRVMTMPGVFWLWIAGGIIALGTVISLLPAGGSSSRRMTGTAT